MMLPSWDAGAEVYRDTLTFLCNPTFGLSVKRPRSSKFQADQISGPLDPGVVLIRDFHSYEAGDTMRSLSGARAELAHLQRRELQLLQELSDVRKALAAQKVMLDELVEASAIPYIDCLPNELLAEIFLLLRYERRMLVRPARQTANTYGQPMVGPSN
ncbi:hypothetical protein EDD15DRAFT_2529637 [Pisolithus albus]|nr:hypothetical protein EDD15DRAFT_2529637 [Pisolithus albus]